MAKKNKDRSTKKKKPLFKRVLLTIVFSIIAIMVITSFYLGVNIRNDHYGDFPSKNSLEKIEHAQATEVFARDGALMGRYYYENRNSISFSEIPVKIINALVATEDARFYEHKGIDIRSLLRVLFKTILLGDRSAGGGSTITQQLAKNLYPRKKEKTLGIIGAKIREMIIAWKLENMYDKDKIIQLYLNTVPFGENTFGVKNAAQLYFGVKPAELDQNQAATLIGMLKATNTYNPHNFPGKATERRNVVLYQMARHNYLSEPQRDSLTQLPLQVNYKPAGQNEGIAPYFREYLRQFLKKWCNENTKPNGEHYSLYSDGLKVYTTLNSKMQLSAEKAVKKHMPVLQAELNEELQRSGAKEKITQLAKEQLRDKYKDKAGKSSRKNRPMEIFTWDGPKTVNFSVLDSLEHYLKLLHTGFIAMHPQSGNILAWVGGINHKFSKYNHVLSKRQMGSVFKPVVYMKALENGVEPCDFYPNDSISYPGYNNWSPENADRKYGGVYSVQGALVNSVNTISVQLLMETGIDTVIKFANNLGIEGKLPGVPSLALGTASGSLMEIAEVYGTIANDGKKVKPNFLVQIENNEGKVLEKFNTNLNASRMISPKIIEQITMMLKNVTKRGTASSLNKNFSFYGEVAGKTGTTQNHSDGWFVGYTPSLTFACWVGAEYPGVHFENIKHGQGAATALPITGYFLQNLKEAGIKDYFGKFKFTNIDTSYYDCADYREKAPGLLEKLLDSKIFKKKDNDKKQDEGLFKKIINVFKKKEKSGRN
jgi:penicillin-binding protein 1A